MEGRVHTPRQLMLDWPGNCLFFVEKNDIYFKLSGRIEKV
jgi:hypothetical protein